MWCKIAKWITVVVTVEMQINRDQIQNPQLIAVVETLTRDNINITTVWNCHNPQDQKQENLIPVTLNRSSYFSSPLSPFIYFLFPSV
jgi:hypothetical protein